FDISYIREDNYRVSVFLCSTYKLAIKVNCLMSKNSTNSEQQKKTLNFNMCLKCATEQDLARTIWPDILKVAQRSYIQINGQFEEKIIFATLEICTILAKGSFLFLNQYMQTAEDYCCITLTKGQSFFFASMMYSCCINK
uniref:Uncharacterized protein n=1 Tax=Strongyloides stercoralis TaxID=6248 RepID=A0AAF5I4E3_STRER